MFYYILILLLSIKIYSKGGGIYVYSVSIDYVWVNLFFKLKISNSYFYLFYLANFSYKIWMF